MTLIQAFVLTQRAVFGRDTTLHHWLEISIPSNQGIDVFRCVAIMAGVLLCAWNVKFASRSWSAMDWLRCALSGGLGLFVAIQEADQIGQPLLIWRLPWLFTLCCIGLVLQWKRMREVQ